MSKLWRQDRRAFLGRLVSAAGSAFLVGTVGVNPAQAQEPAVSPPEDLMREHGALNRILLIYDEGLCRLVGGQTFEPEPIRAAADIVRRFIEDYHEKLEEQHLFPRFRNANKLGELVATLESQHKAGRRLTEEILALAAPGVAQDPSRCQRLVQAMAAFVRMYRPHEAREDTVLFPALRTIVSPSEFDAMGEAFEEREHLLFGREGFEGIVAQIAEVERRLGIYDLAQFTPPR